MHLRKFYILTLFFKLYLFFSIPPHAISSPSKASFELPQKNVVIWSFGHLVILPFCMLDYCICRSLMKRKTDHLMKRKTEQEETRNEVSACSFYILFLQIPLELPQNVVIWSFCRFLCFVIGFVAYLLKIGGNESRRRTISFSSYSIGLFPFILLVLSFPVFSFFLPFFFSFPFFLFPFFLLSIFLYSADKSSTILR